jgi:hypothetical protein
VVVSEWEKLRQDRGQVGIEEMSASKPPLDVSKMGRAMRSTQARLRRPVSADAYLG